MVSEARVDTRASRASECADVGVAHGWDLQCWGMVCEVKR
jgi:hypothetical protein